MTPRVPNVTDAGCRVADGSGPEAQTPLRQRLAQDPDRLGADAVDRQQLALAPGRELFEAGDADDCEGGSRGAADEWELRAGARAGVVAGGAGHAGGAPSTTAALSPPNPNDVDSTRS